eukprot:jgi/Picsp_1/2266/NSC_05730-R1_PREDICTED: hypothetical protein LOC100633885 [Amphimedon queenslandica]
MAERTKDWDNREFSVSHNKTLLFRHISEKGMQFGSVLGVLAVIPVAAFRNVENRKPQRMLQILGTSALGGILFALGMGLFKVSKIPEDEMPDAMQDRAYRLHYNEGQNHVDKLSRIGMVGGGLASLLLTPGPHSARSMLGGAALGSACGVFTHVLGKLSEKKEE